VQERRETGRKRERKRKISSMVYGEAIYPEREMAA